MLEAILYLISIILAFFSPLVYYTLKEEGEKEKAIALGLICLTAPLWTEFLVVSIGTMTKLRLELPLLIAEELQDDLWLFSSGSYREYNCTCDWRVKGITPYVSCVCQSDVNASYTEVVDDVAYVEKPRKLDWEVDVLECEFQARLEETFKSESWSKGYYKVEIDELCQFLWWCYVILAIAVFYSLFLMIIAKK